MGEADPAGGITDHGKPSHTISMTSFTFDTGRDFALEMDQKDPLGRFRERFYIPESDTIYLDGNSLGRLPLATRENIIKVTDAQWGTRLIRSWNEGWYQKPAELSRKLALIIGAGEEEVITGDSTSINLYKLASAALKRQRGRKKIVSDELNFPTDLYVLQGITAHSGEDYKLELVPSRNGMTMEPEDLHKAVDEDTALVVLSHVAFKSAFMYDMKEVTALAHSKGALILWDLSHAAGAVPVDLNDCNADMAVGCTYKYLNGGPGAPAYLFVRKELQDELSSPVWGWFGDANPFDFELQYRASVGIRKFMVGTPPILSMEAVSAGLDIVIEAGMDNIRRKSELQGEYLLYLFNTLLKAHGFSLGSPTEKECRGSHVSLRHPEAYRICKALIEPRESPVKVIPDFRAPDNIRMGITPLYTTFGEIHAAAERMQRIVKGKEYLGFSDEKYIVT
jgi:kynureninase